MTLWADLHLVAITVLYIICDIETAMSRRAAGHVGNGYRLLLCVILRTAPQPCATLIIMKVLVLYRPNSEHGRIMDEFIHEFQARNQNSRLEVMNIDSREGSATASLYDIMSYPAILVLQTDGYLQKSWEGNDLPLVDEVAGFANS